jgi:hypothetical protein
MNDKYKNLYASYDNGVALGKLDGASDIIIDAETISIREKDICIIINVSDGVLSQVESIEINGFKFIKEN